MTLAQLYTRLNSICRTAKGRFHEPVEPPFIIYLDESAESIGADYLNLGKRNFVDINLATETIDKARENQIEEVIKEYEYAKTRIYIDSEKIWQTTYEIEMIEI